jgi:hypothetical protein
VPRNRPRETDRWAPRNSDCSQSSRRLQSEAHGFWYRASRMWRSVCAGARMPGGRRQIGARSSTLLLLPPQSSVGSREPSEADAQG